MRNRINLDRTLTFTNSSYTYKDPYNPRMSAHQNLINRFRTFYANRYIENEFVDYKSDRIVPQLTEIFTDLGMAYKRRDKTTLSRSLSKSMQDYTFSLLKEDCINPFMSKVTLMRPVQSRIYQETDMLLAED